MLNTNEVEEEDSLAPDKWLVAAFVAGLFFLSLGVMDIYRWFVNWSDKVSDIEANKKIYLTQFNSFYHTSFKNGQQTTMVDIVTFTIGLICFFISSREIALKSVSKLFIFMSAILLGWMIFSLM